MKDLRGGKLKDNGVQGFVPAKQQSRDYQHDHIANKDVIPRIDALALGKENGDKIRPATGGLSKETNADSHSVDNAAKDADEQWVGSDLKGGKHIGEDAGQNDHKAGIQCEPLAEKSKADDCRNRIEQQIDERKGKFHVEVLRSGALDEQRKAVKSTGKHISCPDENLNVQRHDKSGKNNQNNSLDITLLFHKR